MYWFVRGGFSLLTGMPRPVLGESCITSIKDFAIFPPHKKKEVIPGASRCCPDVRYLEALSKVVYKLLSPMMPSLTVIMRDKYSYGVIFSV